MKDVSRHLRTVLMLGVFATLYLITNASLNLVINYLRNLCPHLVQTAKYVPQDVPGLGILYSVAVYYIYYHFKKKTFPHCRRLVVRNQDDGTCLRQNIEKNHHS